MRLLPAILLLLCGLVVGFAFGRFGAPDPNPDVLLRSRDTPASVPSAPASNPEVAPPRTRRLPKAAPEPGRDSSPPAAAAEESPPSAPAPRPDDFMPEADPQAEIIFAGRILGADGHPLVGRSLRGALISPLGRVGAFCRTDAAGYFTWRHRGALPLGVERFEIWPQRAPRGRLEVWPQPRERARVPLKSPLRRGQRNLGDLSLRPIALLVEGRVLARGDAHTEAGTPVADASIRIRAWPQPFAASGEGAFLLLDTSGDGQNPVEFKVRTDAKGHFELRHAGHFGRLEVRVDGEGYVPSIPRETTGGAEPLEFRLPRSHSLRIDLRREDGAVLGELSYRCRTPGRDDLDPSPAVFPRLRSAWMTFSGLPRGPVVFEVLDSGGTLLVSRRISVPTEETLFEVRF